LPNISKVANLYYTPNIVSLLHFTHQCHTVNAVFSGHWHYHE
jgi:hypothetical protein